MSARSLSALLIVMAVVAAAAGADFMSRRSAGVAETQPPAEAPTPVTAATVVRKDVPIVIRALGTVQPIESVSVQARVSGQVMQAFFKQGQMVKAGDPMFLIDPRPYQAALDQQQAQLERDRALLAEARTDLARYQKLLKENSIARQKAADQTYLVQQDEGTVKLDQANVESARLNLDYAHINAPATGIAGALQIDPGNCSSSTSAAASTAPPPTSRPPSTRNDLTLIAPIGIILLIGIVKKNAIMMIDFALVAEREGRMSPVDAIHQACLQRFRPIMMTTICVDRGAAVGARDRRRLGAAQAARDHDRRRPPRVAMGHALHDADRLSLSRPAERVGDEGHRRPIFASRPRRGLASLFEPYALARRPVFADNPIGQFLDRGFGGELVELDHAPLDQVDAIADIEDLGVIVGDDDHRDLPAFLQPLDELEDQRRLLDAHRGGGLVEQEHFRLLVDRAGDRNGLALPA